MDIWQTKTATTGSRLMMIASCPPTLQGNEQKHPGKLTFEYI